MIIQFFDSSSIEFKKDQSSNKIIVTLKAKDLDNPLKKTITSAELTVEEFKKLISDVL